LDDSYRLVENRSGGLRCPSCGGACAVVDSRPSSDAHRRRRKCLDCDYRFTTFERPAGAEVFTDELREILTHLDIFSERLSELRGRISKRLNEQD
jgi:transposase-like protein